MPFYPIIYVRGYAMTNHDINETTADPFNGFNLGINDAASLCEPERSPEEILF